MERLRKLALASTATTFLLVTIGGLVRATKSGLGCGDNWPHCPGEVSRAMIIEMSHRTVAGVLVILVGLLAVVAYRTRAEHPVLYRMGVGAFALVLLQALLGAIVVWLQLEAESVVLHLAAAMALLALLIAITVRTLRVEDRLPGTEDKATSRRASIAAASTLLLLLVGSYVTGRNAGYAFPDWPLMNGDLVPDLSNEAYAIHFLHRGLAVVVGVIVTFVAWGVIRRRDRLPLQTRLAHAAAGGFAVEIVVGALNVWTRLNPLSVTVHLALGAFIWGSFVAMAAVSSAVAVPTPEAQPWREPASAMESGR